MGNVALFSQTYGTTSVNASFNNWLDASAEKGLYVSKLQYLYPQNIDTIKTSTGGEGIQVFFVESEPISVKDIKKVEIKLICASKPAGASKVMMDLVGSRGETVSGSTVTLGTIESSEKKEFTKTITNLPAAYSNVVGKKLRFYVTMPAKDGNSFFLAPANEYTNSINFELGPVVATTTSAPVTTTPAPGQTTTSTPGGGGSTGTTTSSAGTTGSAGGGGKTTLPASNQFQVGGGATTKAPSTNKMYIIGGSVIGGLLLLALIIYFYYRSKSKNEDGKKKGKK